MRQTFSLRFLRDWSGPNVTSFAFLAACFVILYAGALHQSAAEPPAVTIPFFYDAAQRLEMENKLRNDPTNVELRSVSVSACARDKALNQATEHILWFIEHQPDHWVLTV